LLDGEAVFFDENFTVDPNKHYIGIGHSLGFQKLNNSDIKFDFLIGLQGFINFCGSNTIIRKKNLDRMIKMFEKDASWALKIFYDACQYNRPVPKEINKDERIKDLISMKKSYSYCGCSGLIIGSDVDKIVPMSVIEDNFRCIPNVVIKRINGIPHILGFIKADAVVHEIFLRQSI
jgi:pimeloyl-[acyl-carrier protein] methyl ester esterase